MTRRSAASVELDQLEQLLGALGGAARRELEQPALEHEQLTAGLSRIEPGLLEGDADLAPGPIRIGRHVDPGDAGGPRRDRHQRGQHLHRGRLAGPVGPEEAEHRPGRDREVDAAHGVDLAVLPTEVLDELCAPRRRASSNNLHIHCCPPALEPIPGSAQGVSTFRVRWCGMRHWTFGCRAGRHEHLLG